MDILFAATELAPFVKVGGLADVTAGLSKALRQLGHKVTLAMPRFPGLQQGGLLMARRLTPLTFELGGTSYDVTVYDGRLGSGVEILLLDVPGLYDRSGVYDQDGVAYADNALRFAVFSRAVVELVRQREAAGAPFDVVHAHDWPAALVPVYRRALAKVATTPPASSRTTPCVLTVHNLAHQGLCDRAVLPTIGLGWDVFHPEYLEFYGKVNPLKGGIVAADKLTTVSVTYSQEIQAVVGGCGLEGVVKNRGADLVGIRNGIDYATWNPATDPTIVARYDAEDPSNKARCKTAVMHELGLELGSTGPLVAFVGRLTRQKGIDLFLPVLERLVFSGASLVVAGDGDPEYIGVLERIVQSLSGKAVFVRAASEALVHRIFAGADITLVPSRFEPCGLVQMYAQRYGALPVVRGVGGLKDTVVDCDATLTTGTGFVFDAGSPEAFLSAVQRAFAAYASPAWPTVRARVMRIDMSWDRPARQYERLYRATAAAATTATATAATTAARPS